MPVIIIALLIFILLCISLIKKCKRVPIDKVYFIYNRVKVIDNGSSVYVNPFIQDYKVFDLSPIR